MKSKFFSKQNTTSSQSKFSRKQSKNQEDPLFSINNADDLYSIYVQPAEKSPPKKLFQQQLARANIFAESIAANYKSKIMEPVTEVNQNDGPKFTTVMVQPVKPIKTSPWRKRLSAPCLNFLKASEIQDDLKSGEKSPKWEGNWMTRNFSDVPQVITPIFTKTSVFSPPRKKYCRQQSFDVQISHGHSLTDGLPFQKYSQEILRTKELQTTIIFDELKIIHDKAQRLKSQLQNLDDVKKVLALIQHDTKLTFNVKFEESIGLLRQICRIILFEYGDKPNELAISNIPNVVSKVIRQESSTLLCNAKIFTDLIDFFKNCIGAYRILAKQPTRKAMKYKNIANLMQFMARWRLNISQLLEIYTIWQSQNQEKKDWLVKTMPFISDKIKSVKQDEDESRAATNPKRRMLSSLKKDIHYMIKHPEQLESEKLPETERNLQNEFINKIRIKGKTRSKSETRLASESHINLQRSETPAAPIISSLPMSSRPFQSSINLLAQIKRKIKPRVKGASKTPKLRRYMKANDVTKALRTGLHLWSQPVVNQIKRLIKERHERF